MKVIYSFRYNPNGPNGLLSSIFLNEIMNILFYIINDYLHILTLKKKNLKYLLLIKTFKIWNNNYKIKNKKIKN